MTIFLIIISLALFLLLSCLKREFGIYLITLLLPTYQIRFHLGPIPLTFLESIILILAAVEFAFLWRWGGLKKFWQTHIVRQKTRSILILLFLVAALVGVAVSPVRTQAAGIFKAYFFESVLFFFLILAIVDNKQKFRNLLTALSLLVLYLSVFGIYQFLTLANLPPTWWAVGIASRRITSLVNHPNALALLLGPILAILVFMPEKKRLDWITIGFGAIAFYLTFSRAAWLALGATLLILGFFTTYRKKVFAGLVMLTIIVLVIPFSRVKLLELTRGNAPTQENRYVLWAAAFDILKKHPLSGAGILGFHEYYKNYPLGPDQVVQNYPHNFFLNFYLETGLLGLASIAGLLVFFYKKIRNLWRSEYRPWALTFAAGMLMILFHGLVDVPYFKNDLAVLFWAIFSLPNLALFISSI